MRKIMIFSIFIFIVQITYSQPSKRIINSYFLKNHLYPISISELFIESGLIGNVKSIDKITNDTTHIQILFDNYKMNAVIFDSTSMNFLYRLGNLSRIIYFKHDSMINQTKIKRIFPFIWIRNNSQKYFALKTFGKIKIIKNSTEFTTFAKTKINYRKGLVYKIKNFDWQTISQKCNYSGYTTYNYLNDTTVIENFFDSNDSLACMNTNVFDSKGNILKVKSLLKKRTTGWGIDASYYAYDGTDIMSWYFDYKFDSEGNWIEKKEYLENKLKNKTIRKIKYEN